jgi:hypothetical protein
VVLHDLAVAYARVVRLELVGDLPRGGIEGDEKPRPSLLFREVIMALQGHLEAMKMEEVVAWLTSWLRTGAAKESPSRSVAWEPRGHLKLLP